MRRPAAAPGSSRRARRRGALGQLPPVAFLSHANLDGAPHAARLDQALRQKGVKTWLYGRDLDESLDFTAKLEQEITSAGVFIACITSDVLREDSYVRREIAYAQLLRKRIAVARFEDIVPPISVVTNTFFEFHADWDAAFARLLAFCQAGQPLSTVVP